MKLQADEISKLNAERAGHQARIHEIDAMLSKHESAIAQEDASKLAELYKDVDPRFILFTDLMQKVIGLEGFEGDPDRVNEQILEAIQAAWIEELD